MGFLVYAFGHFGLAILVAGFVINFVAEVIIDFYGKTQKSIHQPTGPPKQNTKVRSLKENIAALEALKDFTPEVKAPKDVVDTQVAYAFRLMKTDYLKSTIWDTKRKAVLKRDKYVCQQCGATDVALDVHHIMYKNVPSETEKDLVALCRTCHTNTHEVYGYPNTHQEYMDFNADPRN